MRSEQHRRSKDTNRYTKSFGSHFHIDTRRQMYDSRVSKISLCVCKTSLREFENKCFLYHVRIIRADSLTESSIDNGTFPYTFPVHFFVVFSYNKCQSILIFI